MSDHSMPLPSRLGLYAFLGSGALILGALYFQYFQHLDPCEMCMWQRYPHFVAIAFGLLAVLAMRAPQVALLCVLVAITALLITSGIGVFHFGVEEHLWKGPQACTGTIPGGLSAADLKKYLEAKPMVRCDVPAWKMWNISMAGWNAIFSGGLALLLIGRVVGHIRGTRVSRFA
jgi:disulfide bond formation protein DsbB